MQPAEAEDPEFIQVFDYHTNEPSYKRWRSNRANAQLSTGPRTDRGKKWSRRNALKHGILSSALLLPEPGTEDEDLYRQMLCRLRCDRAPVGQLEEMMVEKIAVSWWRLHRALRFEAQVIESKARERDRPTIYTSLPLKPAPESPGAKSRIQPLCLPSDDEMNRILRYDAASNRQLYQAINQLERLQRVRKGEHVPAPVNVQVSNDG